MDDRTLDAARRLSFWIDAQLEAFRPARDAAPLRFRDVKPFGDLALVTLALTGPGRRGELAAWGDLVASRLWHDATLLQERFPPRAQALVAFPALEVATGRRFPFHDRIATALQSEPATLDAAFASDLQGHADCRTLAVATLERELETAERDPTLSSLYNITHAIFFGTLLGRRTMSAPPRLDELLSSNLRNRIARGQHDIVAELVAALAWSGGSAQPAFREGVETLVLAAEAEGSIATDPRAPAARHDFRGRYHATLTALAALTAKETE